MEKHQETDPYFSSKPESFYPPIKEEAYLEEDIEGDIELPDYKNLIKRHKRTKRDQNKIHLVIIGNPSENKYPGVEIISKYLECFFQLPVEIRAELEVLPLDRVSNENLRRKIGGLRHLSEDGDEEFKVEWKDLDLWLDQEQEVGEKKRKMNKGKGKGNKGKRKYKNISRENKDGDIPKGVKYNGSDMLRIVQRFKEKDTYILIGLSYEHLFRPDISSDIIMGWSQLGTSMISLPTCLHETPKDLLHCKSSKTQKLLDEYEIFKTIGHEGLHAAGIWHCVHYDCMMNSQYVPVDINQPMYLCPHCLTVFHLLLDFDVLARWRQLSTFYKGRGFKNVGWIKRRILQWVKDTK